MNTPTTSSLRFPGAAAPATAPRTRCLRALALFATTVLPAGCQFSTERPVEPVQARPIIVDAAMQRRDWDPVVATYESGAVLAGPTGFILEPTATPEGRVLEVPLFLVNVAAMPVALTATPLWTPVIYRGIITEPSYTKAEPYPEDIEAAQQQYQRRSRRTSSANPADAQDAASRAGNVSGQVPTNNNADAGAGALNSTGNPAAPNPTAGTAAQGTANTGTGANTNAGSIGAGTNTGTNTGTGTGNNTGANISGTGAGNTSGGTGSSSGGTSGGK